MHAPDVGACCTATKMIAHGCCGGSEGRRHESVGRRYSRQLILGVARAVLNTVVCQQERKYGTVTLGALPRNARERRYDEGGRSVERGGLAGIGANSASEREDDS